MDKFLFIAGAVVLFINVCFISDNIKEGLGFFYAILSTFVLAAIIHFTGIDEAGTKLFLLNVVVFFILTIWMFVMDKRTKDIQKLEKHKKEQEEIAKENKVVNCYWSFTEDGERYCCKNDEIIKQTLLICKVNCKGFSEEDALNN